MRRFLCDWQIPDFLDEAVLDVDYFLDQAVKAGAETIEFGLKNAFGNSLFPTKIGKQNRALKEDYFAEICAKAPERGLAVVAYYNMLLDDLMGKEHPEWLQRSISGEPLKFESYDMFCMNSPYRDYVFKSLEEIARSYNVSGFMFDIQYWHPKGCYCPYCAGRFQEEGGKEFSPSSFNLQDWKVFDEFRRKWRREFILTARERLLNVDSRYTFTWNGSGNFSDDPDLEQYVSHYGTEAHPPAYTACSVKARWLASSRKPFSMWMPESIGSWGHFTVTTPKTMIAMCAMTLANGGAVTANHIPMPAGDYRGRAFRGVYAMLNKVMGWVKDHEEYAGGAGIKCAGLFHSIDNTAVSKLRGLARGGGISGVKDQALGVPNAYAAGQLLEELHIPFEFIHGEAGLLSLSPQELNQYEVIILPNTGYLRGEAVSILKSYVTGGGKLLSFYNTGLLSDVGEERENFVLTDVYGADFMGYSDFSLSYVDRFDDEYRKVLPDMPILIKDTGYQTNPVHRAVTCKLRDGGEVLAYFTDPVLEADWEKGYHIYHDHAPPGRITDKPAIIRNQYGKGESIYFAFPLLQAFAFLPNPWLRNIVAKSLELLGVPGRIRVEGAVSVKSYLRIINRTLYLHLINLHREGDSMFLEESPAPSSVRCILRGQCFGLQVLLMPAGTPLTVETGENTSFNVTCRDIHTIVEIGGYPV
jgi:hypothetical protein